MVSHALGNSNKKNKNLPKLENASGCNTAYKT